ncbi:hypothetical protein SSX86_003290 [Deinandra increscens subsp. villosa]|uniref:Uncharacterized protein n=1 Tax=Deinandra increscens subsp. villosa TaxID=3103831 RepID=A0AAP0H7M4_9ASTR
MRQQHISRKRGTSSRQNVGSRHYTQVTLFTNALDVNNSTPISVTTTPIIERLSLPVDVYASTSENSHQMSDTNVEAADFETSQNKSGGTSGPTPSQVPFTTTPPPPAASLPSRTPIPTRQSQRHPTTAGVKRSFPTDTGLLLPTEFPL